MGSVWFSVYAGIVAVFIIPLGALLVISDTYRRATRPERIELLQFSVLTGTTGLAAWTHFWIEPGPDYLMIASGPLWLFCGIGVAISTALGLLRLRLRLRRQKLEARVLAAIHGR